MNVMLLLRKGVQTNIGKPVFHCVMRCKGCQVVLGINVRVSELSQMTMCLMKEICTLVG